MKGSYRVIVSNSSVRYDFVIRRNITIIKGDSATGKTTLVEMVNEYYESGTDSGIELRCDRPCRAIGGRDWKAILSLLHETIVFIDEVTHSFTAWNLRKQYGIPIITMFW